MNEMTTDDLWLAALAKPENFQGEKLERLLFQRRQELARRIREIIGSDTSQIAQLIKLILNTPFTKKHAQGQSRSSLLDQIQAHKNMQIPDEAISREADLLENVYRILQSESPFQSGHDTDYVI